MAPDLVIIKSVLKRTKDSIQQLPVSAILRGCETWEIKIFLF